MTFRFPSVVNAAGWKTLGRVPRLPPSDTKCYDPLALIAKMKQKEGKDAGSSKELKATDNIRTASMA
jgi:hypothetical protein